MICLKLYSIMMMILEPRFSSPRSLLSSFSPAVSLKPPSPWEPQALQGLLNGWRWTPFSDFGAGANLETLLVRVRLGWGTGWHPEQKALQGLLLTREGDTGDWEAYCFLLLFADPVLENQLTQKEKMEKRVPEVEHPPPLHPGSRRYGLSDAPGQVYPRSWVRPECARSCEVQGPKGSCHS